MLWRLLTRSRAEAGELRQRIDARNWLLSGGREAVNRFLRKAPGIPFSPSLGHTTTTCSHPATTSHRYVSPAEKKRQGIGDGLVRLSVGVEDVEEVKAEMAKGLA